MAPITGVTAFPNVGEPAPADEGSSPPEGGGDPAAGDLAGRRWVEHIEDLRGRVDAAAAASGTRASVFLATIGPPAQFTVPATFATNFFGVAGLAAPTGPVTSDPAEIAAAFAAHDATVACICSADHAYTEVGRDVVNALTAAGARRVYLAGTPADEPRWLEQAGAVPIGAGTDAYATLTDLVDVLGIPS